MVKERILRNILNSKNCCSYQGMLLNFTAIFKVKQTSYPIILRFTRQRLFYEWNRTLSLILPHACSAWNRNRLLICQSVLPESAMAENHHYLPCQYEKLVVEGWRFYDTWGLVGLGLSTLFGMPEQGQVQTAARLGCGACPARNYLKTCLADSWLAAKVQGSWSSVQTEIMWAIAKKKKEKKADNVPAKCASGFAKKKDNHMKAHQSCENLFLKMLKFLLLPNNYWVARRSVRALNFNHRVN